MIYNYCCFKIKLQNKLLLPVIRIEIMVVRKLVRDVCQCEGGGTKGRGDHIANIMTYE